MRLPKVYLWKTRKEDSKISKLMDFHTETHSY